MSRYQNTDAGVRLINLIERLGRILTNAGHAEGLKPVQWEALRYLARANRFSRRPAAVTRFLGLTKGTVSQTLIALENKGLIKRVAAAADRRSIHLTLTIEGRKLIQRDPARRLNAALEQLDPRQIAAGSELLQELLLRALKDSGGAPFGVCSTCRHFRRDVPGGNPNLCDLLREPLTAEDATAICVEHTPN